jgi:Protein of unknown function (DUF2851)
LLGDIVDFSEEYGRIHGLCGEVREAPGTVPERVVQCVWYEQRFSQEGLHTKDGRALRIVSPGWWNHEEGPDFKGAQIEVNGVLKTGDVEIHLAGGAWRQHGHDNDPRYDGVLLEVVLEPNTHKAPSRTSTGREVPCLALAPYLEEDITAIAARITVDDFPHDTEMAGGMCAAMTEAYGAERVCRLLILAGEWRAVTKARMFRDRMARVGPDQALYEAFLTACGFSRYKHQFRTIAQQLPFDRARQLARLQPLLLETAFLQLSGLLPDELPPGTPEIPHFARIHALRREFLGGLRKLPLIWERTHVRPNNYPERRLAGAAVFVSRHANTGLTAVLDDIWRRDAAPVQRRKMFEDLFPRPLGFWTNHCSWTGKCLGRPVTPFGQGRVRAIIGNVFVPAELALARERHDRRREEEVLEFFAALPREPGNTVLRAMKPRLFGDVKPPRMSFRLQQGLLQVYQDWCQPNPSCRNCAIVPFLDAGYQPGSSPFETVGG